MGAAYGYSPSHLEPFVKSLRRNWSGDCLLVTSPLDDGSREFFNKHDVITFELEDAIKNPKDLQTLRYPIYKSILDNHFYDVEQILITDARDVVFQDDPFKGSKGCSLEFFLEPSLFRNCRANWPWIGGLYGREGMEMVQDHYIVCSGTTIGTRKGLVDYLDIMIKEIERISATGRKVYPGEDQPIHNYLIYSGQFKDYVLHHNGEGPVSTLNHQSNFTFNRTGEMLNKDGSPIPVVHQWDRTGVCKPIIEALAVS